MAAARTTARRLLTPEALAKVSRLELLARGMVEGFVTGRHKSPYKGFSAEFAEHRQYVAGDDIGDLDWRVYGRSDRYYVKQYMEETNLRATILLDASGSMKYAGDKSGRFEGRAISKFVYGQLLAASLSHLLIHQQDAVGLVTFDTAVRRYIPARSRPSHLNVLLESLDDCKTGGETGLAAVLHDVAERIRRRGLVIIISDFLDDAEEIVKALHHFRFRKHEVLALHVLAREELAFPFDSWSVFRDLEIDGRDVQIDGKDVRSEYMRQVQAFVRYLESGCGQMHADYVPMPTDIPFENALAGYLAGRHGR
jgi:uncharacterized protein (DUF58 family)